MTGNWQNWGDERYADMLYRRARGELPEMESSKAVARRIKAIWKTGDTILDVGCGAGHYLVSLRRELGPGFDYCGVDYLERHVELARKAFSNDLHARFEVADVHKLPYASGSFDIVTCNNLLLSLPALREPLYELLRVARKALVLRLLCGDRTYLIREVHPHDPELDASGAPLEYNFYNIYSRRYVSQLLQEIGGFADHRIEPDTDFSAENLKPLPKGSNPPQGTYVIGNLQFIGYIMLPWSFLTIEK
jgi:ubiquinone/menaquinone biosynthesis C-methylase UbiE